MGVARGHIDLDFASMKQSVSSAVQELKKLERQDSLVDSELNKLRQTAALTGQAMDKQAEQVKFLSAQLQTAKTRADTYKKGMEDMKSSMERAAQEQKNLTTRIQENLEAQKQTEDRLKALTPAYQDAQKAIKKAADQYGTESEECQKAAQEHEKAVQAYENAAKKADELRNQLVQLEGKQKLANTTVQQASGQLEEYQTALNNTEADIASLTAELKTAESKAVSFGDALQNAGGKMSSAADKAGSVGTKLTLGVTAPIIGIGTAAVNAGNDFEAQMSRVSAISGAYGDDLEQLREQAIELGAQTSFSATESAQAMENLASAGFGTQEIMAAMPGMLNLAASSGEDLASSADIAASTLRGFQLEASEAGHVADVLAKNAADTNAAIADTGLAMKYIAPVAQSVGWSLEEVTTAIGVMADAGIKGEQAGTTLRGALTRLMKPTKDMYESMDDLGISFYDAQGKMKPLSTIVDELQKSTKGLTDEQRDNHLATIFGTEALSGMKVLLGSSKEELDRMTDGLKNADGAAKKMADTMLDNTKGSIEEMNGSLETAGITIQKQLAPWITKGAEKVTELANEFSQLDENTQGTILTMGGIAAASGPVIKGLSGVTGGIGKLVKGTGGLIKDLGKISSAKKAAEAIGTIGEFSVKSVDGVSGLSQVLYKLASPTGIAVAAAGVLAGIGIAVYNSMEQAKQAAIDADLEQRFGDIALSMEEVEDIAEQLTTNDWTMQVDAVITAKGELDELKQNVQSSVEELNKLGWKINVGLGLSQEENESFRTSMDSFVSDSIAYVQQKQYTATLAVNAIMTPGSQSYRNVQNFVDEFYSGSQKEMQDLGKTMAAEVDKALADGVITEDEYLNIQNIQAKLQELINQVEGAQYNAEIKTLQLGIDENGLSVESLTGLMTAANEKMQADLDAEEQVYLDAKVAVQLTYEKGGYKSEEAYEEALRDIQEDWNRKNGNIVLETVTLGIGEIQGKYQPELSQFQTEFSDTISRIITDGYDNASGEINYTKLQEAIAEDFGTISDTVRGGAQELLNSMEPNTQKLESIAQEYAKIGKIPPENIRKGLEDTYELEMMSGNVDYLYKYLATQVAYSPELQKAIKTSHEKTIKIPEELAAALKDVYGLELIEDGSTAMWQTVGEQAQTSAQIMQGTFRQYGIELPDALAAGLDSKSAALVEATLQLLQNLEEGQKLKDEDLTSVFSTLGVDLPESLISSLAEQNPNVQQQAIELFAQIQYADDEKRPELLGQMLELGQKVDESLCSGIAGNLVLVKDEATGMISVLDSTTGKEITRITPGFAKKLKKMGSTGFDSMDEAIKSGKLTAPEVDDIDTKPVEDWQSNSQYYLDQHPLSATVHAGGGASFSIVANNADGGIIQKETLSWLAEGDQPEAVIPLSSSKRSRGIELWQQAGEALGVMDAARNTMAAQIQGTGGGSNTRQVAAALAAELRRAPIEVNPQFHVSAGDVYLDKDRVGHSLSPVIDTELSQIQGIRRRGG